MDTGTAKHETAHESVAFGPWNLLYRFKYSDNRVAKKELAKSFGRDMYDSYLRHDIQGLNRVLFEKQEGKIKMANLVWICPYGVYDAVKSCCDIYVSVKKYAEVQHQEGNNKHHAEEGLQDGSKGVLFLDFAPAFQLQLKQYGYDYMRGTMFKINEPYKFPSQLVLDRDGRKHFSPDADLSTRNLDRYKFHDAHISTGCTKKDLEQQHGFEEEDLWPLNSEKSMEGFLLFVELYNPKEEELCFVGRLLKKALGKSVGILTKQSATAGFMPSEEVELYECYCRGDSSSKRTSFAPMDASGIGLVMSVQSLALHPTRLCSLVLRFFPKLRALSPGLLNKFLKDEHVHPPLMEIAASKLSELPLEVLMDIFALLEIPDLVRAGSVCSSWNSVYSNICSIGQYKQQQTPCLLYTSESAGENVACLYSLAEKRAYKLTLPEPPIHRRHLIGSSHGWLVTVDECSEMHLVNPITSEQISLPSVITLDHVTPIYDNAGAICKYCYWNKLSITLAPGRLRYYLHHKALLLHDTSTGSYIVVFIHNPWRQLAFARLGDKKWTQLTSHEHILDCVYKGGLLYAVTAFGEIIAFDINGTVITTRIIMDRVQNHFGTERVYIVHAPWGDLLQVWSSQISMKEGMDGHQDGPTFQNRAGMLRIYKVCTKAKKLEEIDNLGDHILFIGNIQSLCSRAEEYPQLKPNHVYFTDDSVAMALSCEWGFRLDIGVLNFENKMMEEIVFPRPWSNCMSPVLIIPNLRRMDSTLQI